MATWAGSPRKSGSDHYLKMSHFMISCGCKNWCYYEFIKEDWDYTTNKSRNKWFTMVYQQKLTAWSGELHQIISSPYYQSLLPISNTPLINKNRSGLAFSVFLVAYKCGFNCGNSESIGEQDGQTMVLPPLNRNTITPGVLLLGSHIMGTFKTQLLAIFELDLKKAFNQLWKIEHTKTM